MPPAARRRVGRRVALPTRRPAAFRVMDGSHRTSQRHPAAPCILLGCADNLPVLSAWHGCQPPPTRASALLPSRCALLCWRLGCAGGQGQPQLPVRPAAGAGGAPQAGAVGQGSRRAGHAGTRPLHHRTRGTAPEGGRGGGMRGGRGTRRKEGAGRQIALLRQWVPV